MPPTIWDQQTMPTFVHEREERVGLIHRPAFHDSGANLPQKPPDPVQHRIWEWPDDIQLWILRQRWQRQDPLNHSDTGRPNVFYRRFPIRRRKRRPSEHVRIFLFTCESFSYLCEPCDTQVRSIFQDFDCCISVEGSFLRTISPKYS